jgi:hypothetical protein
MKRTSLIRLGGLAAMVGGGAWVALWLLGDWLVRQLPLGPIESHIQSGSIQGPILNLLVVGGMAAIIAIAVLHASRSERYGSLAVLATLTAAVGLVMGLVGWLVFERTVPLAVAATLVTVGLLLASVGIVGLGIVTIRARVLPWWCGVALIAGSPPSAAFLWPLMGVPWMVVGYAVLRAAGDPPQQPSRVR